MAAPCATCGATLRFRTEQVEERQELRSGADQKRLRTWRRRLVCRRCAEGDWAAHDGCPTTPAPVAPLPDDDPHRPWLGWLTPDEMVGRLLAMFPGTEVVEEEAGQPWTGDAAGGRCGACGVPLRAATAVEDRVEYRAVDSLARLRTWRVRWLCEDCTADVVERHDHPHGRQSAQEALL